MKQSTRQIRSACFGERDSDQREEMLRRAGDGFFSVSGSIVAISLSFSPAPFVVKGASTYAVALTCEVVPGLASISVAEVGAIFLPV
jgi:hypothetical protein